MYTLTLLGKRIEHTRRECQKRIHVANLAVECLQLFLSDLPPDAPTDSAARLQFRYDFADLFLEILSFATLLSV